MATQVGSDMLITPGDLTMNTSTNPATLGARGVDSQGNSYRLCKAGGTALVVGKLQQSSAEDTATQNLAVAAAAIGATSITTTTTVTVTANEYAGGWVMVTVTPGVGYKYLISSHPAASGAVVTLTLADPLVVALTTDSRIDLVRNAYQGLVVNPTTLTSAPAGVAVTAITAAQFGWVQTGGVACVLADGANAVGSNVVASNGVAGAVEDAAAPGAQPLVGTMVTGVADQEYGAVLLNLRGA